jgi:hypothetical protein
VITTGAEIMDEIFAGGSPSPSVGHQVDTVAISIYGRSKIAVNSVGHAGLIAVPFGHGKPSLRRTSGTSGSLMRVEPGLDDLLLDKAFFV